MKDTKKLAEKNNDLYRDKPTYPKKKLRLTLDLPLSINHMYYNAPGGGKNLTAKALRYVRDSRAYMNAVIRDTKWIKQCNSTWYYLDMVVYMPDRRVRDSHNLLKLLLDTMEGIIYTNDYYVMPCIKAVEYDKSNPRLELILRPQTEKERQDILKAFN